MNRLLSVALMALLLPGCATLKKHTQQEEPARTKIVPVAGRTSDAHVCPTSKNTAMTAWHVAFEVNPRTWEIRPRYLMFTGKDGKPGTLVPKMWDPRRDLAVMVAIGAEFPGWYGFAEEIPKAGDKVKVSGYIMKEGMAQGIGEYTVLTPNIAGQIRYSGSPMGGSSGSCILNKEDEIVGINTAYYASSGGIDITIVGSGWLVVGPWREIPELFWREVE